MPNSEECTFDGCHYRQQARGICSGHYAQVRRGQSLHPLRKMIRKADDPIAYFWSRVAKSADCWIWTGGLLFPNGYGVAYFNGRNQGAHRVAYQLEVGPLDDRMVDHICRNKKCVRPSHLRLVDYKQNAENLDREMSSYAWGFRGVYTYRDGKRFEATVIHHGKRHRAGVFDTVEEAAEAARILRLQLFTHNNADYVRN